MSNVLSNAELQRYARHLTLKEIGRSGQERLRASRVLIVGAGGLGSPAALYLAAAGVGTIGIVDHDRVDISNLQRQVLHDTAAVGLPKTGSAAARIVALNPHVAVDAFNVQFTSANAREIVQKFDVVIDGSDNFPTRYLVNDSCVLEGKPLVYGSILRFDGQLSLFAVPGGPCYRCLFSEPPPAELIPNCADAGVVGVLPGIIGSMQALEAIKWIVGCGTSMVGRLLLFDALAMQFREIAVRRDPDCVVCGDRRSLTELIDYEDFCNVAPLGGMMDQAEIQALELRDAIANGTPFLLDVREQWEADIAMIAGSALVPLGSLPNRLADIPRDQPIVTICHFGARSLSARALLIRAGFSDVKSLAGGIDAWATSVDSSVERY